MKYHFFKYYGFKNAVVTAIVFFQILIFISCEEDKVSTPTGIPMISISFNGDVENSGMLNVNIQADSNVVFSPGIKDSCLDLSGDAVVRMPVVVSCAGNLKLKDYDEFTIEVWAKKVKNDNDHYVIAACKKETANSFRGWEITSECNGSWALSFSDGNFIRRYAPTSESQDLNDGRWHQIVFSYSGKKSEIRIFFDGKNRALYSLSNVKNKCEKQIFYIGTDPLSTDMEMEAFNGYIDDFKVWARALSNEEIRNSYFAKTGFNIRDKVKFKDKITVLSWNIWHGGRHKGKYVGVQRVIDVIRNAGADVVLLQETDGSGEIIADALDFYYFSRSDELSVLSRFPLAGSYNIYKPGNFGCVEIDISKGNKVLFCPVKLNNLPNIGAYVKSGNAIPDTIVEREAATRGRQMRFILGELSSFSPIGNNTIVVAGDFNTGSHLDWTERTKDKHDGLVVEFPVSRLMADQGYTDTYRDTHPDEVKYPGYTWSPYFTNTLQDRIDYIYYKGEGLSPVTSYVIDTHPKGFPSSHAALVTVFFNKKKNEK
jgi:endonuclease/exonuclease/phosphatase family metal-dependent hydrolase